MNTNNPTYGIQAACIQLCSSTDVEENISQCENLIREAAKLGARLICTPEMTSLVEKDKKKLLEKTAYEEEEKSLLHFIDLAAELKVSLIIGSLPIKISPTHCANRCYAIDSAGSIQARYDKIHLFDAAPSGREAHKESDSYISGNQAMVVTLEGIKIGLSICYDLRFPKLYNDLAKAGAELLVIPAAFTQSTGKAHWHTLVRARAIENGCFVLAPAQSGSHADGRRTYGHSLIVSPWGEVLADAGNNIGAIKSNIDLDLVKSARGRISNLNHQKEYLTP